ncbi:flagellar biosynthetic protein FliR [Methylomarinum vadi]|uniref:flagellar biosynthetic protein FliR n=1 Tax=Methylomarinum vadi TaxID=438855 RepID=UPI0004DFBE30|nr:flagellar biosynthetic protein FliR [Methylomarinum vadi]
MIFSEEQLLGLLASYMWPYFRIGSMFISVPVFSVQAVPARIRVLASLLITSVIVPVLPSPPDIALFSYQGFMVAVQQIVLGITAGFILQMVFSVILVAGQSIAYSMGLGFASLVDPATGIQVPVVAQVFVIAVSLLFLSYDGHLLLIEVLAQSFTTLPIAATGLNVPDLWRVIAWSSQIFAGGVLLALPVMVTILFVNISFGVASRAAPQLQIFGVGFPITIMLGMLLIWITLPDILESFADILREGFALISELLRLP